VCALYVKDVSPKSYIYPKLFHESQHPTYIFIIKKRGTMYTRMPYSKTSHLTFNTSHTHMCVYIYIYIYTLSYPYSDNIIFRCYILIQVFPTRIHCIHTKVFRGADINLFSLTPPFLVSSARSLSPHLLSQT